MEMSTRITSLALLFSLAAHAGNAASFELVADTGEAALYETVVNRDRWTLVIVWAHDCIPCEAQKPMLSQFNRDNLGYGVSVVGLSSDDTSLQPEARATLNRTTVSFRNYLYNGPSFGSDYLSRTGVDFIGTPTYLVHDPTGAIANVHVGAITRADLDRYFVDKRLENAFTPSADLIR